MSSGNEAILIGKVSTTHGVRGQLRVASLSGDVDSFLSLQSVLLKKSNGKMDSFAVSTVKAHGKKVILGLKGFNNINEVLHLVGSDVYVLREQLPVLADDEFYWCDLLGLSVVTEDGEVLGDLADIISTGSNDVYVVQGREREVLVPALDDVVLEVDLTARRMVVRLPEGLLDL